MIKELIKFIAPIKKIFNIIKQMLNNLCSFLTKQMLYIKNKIWPIKFTYSKKFYSQDGEDAILYSFYENRPDYIGFYVDIGAYHPYKFSNTQLFHEKDWRGINIDATPKSMKLFNKFRPNDINLECAVSNKKEELTYFSFEEGALNSFDEKLSTEYVKSGNELKEKIPIQTCLINDILNKFLPYNQKIDFINIDIEGLELRILKSFDFDKYSPNYFLIEELDYIDSDFMNYTESDIYKLLKSEGYNVVAKTRRTVIYQKCDWSR